MEASAISPVSAARGVSPLIVPPTPAPPQVSMGGGHSGTLPDVPEIGTANAIGNVNQSQAMPSAGGGGLGRLLDIFA